MKLFKRTLSLFLAFMMVFTSVSLLASADLGEDPDKMSWKTTWKYYREATVATKDADGNYVKDADGNIVTQKVWVETNKISRGDKVKARLFLETNFAIAASENFFFFHEDFFTVDKSETSGLKSGGIEFLLPVNTKAKSEAAIASLGGGIMFRTDCTDVAENLIYEDEDYFILVQESEFDKYDWAYTQISSGSAITFSGEEWFYEIPFVVNENADGYAGVFTPEGAIRKPFPYDYATMFYNKQPAGDGATLDIGVMDAIDYEFKHQIAGPNYDYDADILYNNPDKTEEELADQLAAAKKAMEAQAETEGLSVKTNVSFNLNGGTIDGASTVADITGYVGDDVITLPANPKKVIAAADGTTTELKFLGWEKVAEKYVVEEQVFDEDGDPVLDDSGNPTYKDVEYYDPDGGIYYVDADTAALAGNANFAGYIADLADDTFDYSDATFKAVYQSPAKYQQNVYLQNIDDNEYTKSTGYSDTIDAIGGDIIKAADYEVPTGFVLNAVKSTESITVSADTEEVLDIYLDRKTFTATFKSGLDGATVETKTGKYEAAIPVPSAATVTGYNFTSWSPAVPATFTADGEYVAQYAAAGANINITYTYVDKANGNKVVTDTFTKASQTGFNYAIVETVPQNPDANTTYITYDEILNVDHYALDTESLGDKATGTVPAAGVNLAVAYAPVTYTATFTDGTPATVDVVYYESIAEADVPAAKEAEAGWQFDGWYNGDEKFVAGTTKITGDVTFTAKYVKTPRTITYVYEGAPAGQTAPEAVTGYIGDPINLPPLPEDVEGYNIGEWVITNDDGNGKVGTKDVTVTSTWTLEGYTVTLDLDDGEAAVDSIAKNYGSTLAASELPEVTKAGYDHVGWTLDGADATFPMTIKGDITLKAKLELHKYDITYAFSGNKPAGVDVPAAVKGTMGSDIPQPIINDVEGYSFGGWTFANEDGTEITDGKVGTQNVVATGKWTLNSHTVSYVTGIDGVTIDPITRRYGVEITAPTDISTQKAGYTFNGWKDKATDKIVTFPFNMPDRDVELVADWTAIERTITYVYVGAPAGYTAPAAVKGTIGTAIVLPELPTVDGYAVGAWEISGDDGAGKVGLTDVTVTSTWTKNAYTVTFYADEAGTKVHHSEAYSYGDTLKYPATNPAKTGYTFDAWDQPKDMEITGALKVYPIFAPIPYAVTVIGLYDAELEDWGWDATYGDEITLGDLPSADDMDEEPYYTFNGWLYNGNLMTDDTVVTVEGPITFTASYTAADAKLIFNANGAVFAENGKETIEVPLKYDDVITEDMYPEVPEFEGHTFKSWSEYLADGTMDELEKTVSINWTKNTYTVKFVNGLTNTEITSVTGEYGSDVAAPALPTETGYTFAWDVAVPDTIPAKDEKGTLMAAGGTYTVTAVPTAETYTVTYMVNGTAVATKSAAFGSAIDATVTPAETEVPAGYKFIGWNLVDGATAAGALGNMPAKNVTVYAVLQAQGEISYTVEIYKETLTDGSYDMESTVYTDGTAGAAAPYVVDTDVEGFDYMADKSVIPETIKGDGTSVLKIYYDRRTISVVVGDDEPIDVPYGTEIQEPTDTPDPTDPGQEFDKWVDEDGEEVTWPYPVPDSEDNDPVVITPTYKNRMINVYYNVGGTVIKTVETEYSTAIDSTIRPAEGEVPAGYTFLGWNLVEGAKEVGVLGNMPAKEVTVYAVLEAHTNVVYTVEIYEESLTDGVYDKVSSNEYRDGTAGEAAPYVIDKNVEGFTFNADKTEVPAEIAGDGTSVLKIYYDRKTITVQIGNDKPIDVPYGTEIDLPNDPDDNDPGTEFDKWVDEDGKEVADPFIVPDSEDGTPVIITPVYKNNSFNVVFIDELNGKTSSQSLEYTTKIPNPGSPSAEGYEFNGWYTKDAAGNYVDKYVAGTTTVPNADVTYYAKYTGLDVTYIVNVYFENVAGTGWETVQSTVVDGVAGETAKYTETFDGFTLDKDISTTESVIKGDSSTVLVIYFTRNDVKITVDDKEIEVPYGTEITEDDLTADVTPGYKVDKWTDGEGNEITFPVEIKGGEEFIPVLVKESYSLKFQLADGTTVGTDATAEFDSDIVAPQAPDAAEGYTFAGWVDKATNEPFNGKMPAKDTVYVAVYTNNEDAKYTVNIYIMNTSGVEELSGSYTATAAIGTTQSVVPGTVEFCTLDTAKSNTSCVVLADGTATINLYFVRGLYTVSFDGVETEVYAGAVIPVPADPAQDGKTFLGWTPAVPDVMPENDLEFESTWEDVIYTITYIVNGDEIVHEYKLGEAVTEYEVTEAPAGLTFKGWSGEIPATMPAKNITVSAIFESAAYTVTYLDAEGNVFVSYSVAYGAEIPVPTDAPEKEFYTFVGWEAAPATMPNHNVTIKPVFDPVPVQLVAAPGSTTVIDRDNMVIYGLEEGLTAKSLDEIFLDYTGDGTMVIKPATEGTSRYGTGAVVELYDNADGSLVETFHIVVFGDLNGDSYVNGIDVSIASDEAFWITDWSLEGSENYAAYKLIAADLDHNGAVKTTDVNNIKNYVLSLVDIDQVEGKVVRS